MNRVLEGLTVDAVHSAMAEYRALGQDAFLLKYGFRKSRIYTLIHDGYRYDSKAIVGAAVGFLPEREALTAKHFSGGALTVLPALRKLGFHIEVLTSPSARLVVGEVYQRTQLRDWFGGQLQSGIWTPAEFPAVFLFSGNGGAAYGYKDEWKNGSYHYTGEGQKGDMTYSGGNAAIKDHREKGEDLYLFESLGKGKGVRYDGIFELEESVETIGKDVDRNDRRVIVFVLRPVGIGGNSSGTVEPDLHQIQVNSLDHLRRQALAAISGKNSNKKTGAGTRSWYERSAAVVNYAIKRANGHCENCELPAPFKRISGVPYLEVHHTHRLADGGLDHPRHVAAICPTCHREIHSGEHGVAKNNALQIKIFRIEPEDV